LLIVAVALLAVTAQPVAAQNASAAASEHTTFGAGSQGEPTPTTLTNMSVTGSGPSASVVPDTTTTLIDDYEDNDISEYSGDTGAFSVASSDPISGSYSLEASGQSTYRLIKSSGQLPQADQGNITAKIRPSTTNHGAGLILGRQDSANRYDILILAGGLDEIRLDERQGGSTTTMDSAAFSPQAATTYTLDVSWTTITGGVRIVATVRDSNGNALETLSFEDTDGTSWTSGGTGWTYTLGDGEPVTYDDLQQTGGDFESATYVGAPHDAEDIDAGFANLTLSDAEATVTWQEDGDGDGTWTTVTSATHTTTGNYTADLSGTQADRWRVRVGIDATGANPVAEIHDEGLLFDPDSPSANMSGATPTGKTTSSPVNISVPVSDPDFETAQGDNVTVDIQVRPSSGSFSTISTQTIASNQTVLTQFAPTEGGEYDYRAVMTDSYGSNTTSATATFSTPAQLTVYRESINSTKISNANVRIRFYPVGESTGQVVTRTTTNGVINLTALPVNQAFVAVANASGYESRRIFIRSLYEQQRMYLLNDSVDSAETIFKMQDYTGRYPPDNTVLEIRRSINGDWQTISGDYFGGSAEYPATLEIGARYRLRLYNPETGDTRPLGTYQPITAQTQTIAVSPESGVDDLEILPTVTIKPQTRRVPALNDTQISASITEVENVTVDSWRVTVVRNSTTVVNTAYAGSTQQSTFSVDLAGYAGDQVNITVVATLSDGRTFTAGSAILSVYESPTNSLSLLTLVTEFVGLAAPGTAGALTSFLASILTIFVMAGISTQLPVSGETTALAGVLTLTGFSVIGWVGYGVVFVSGSAVVAFAALRRGL